jgi:hypothetical protein
MAAALLHRYVNGIISIKKIIDLYKQITPSAHIIVLILSLLFAVVSSNYIRVLFNDSL